MIAYTLLGVRGKYKVCKLIPILWRLDPTFNNVEDEATPCPNNPFLRHMPPKTSFTGKIDWCTIHFQFHMGAGKIL